MIPEKDLRLALEEYDRAVMAALPDPAVCDHTFSQRFERKMRGVCRRAKHPVAYKMLQRAACILLVLLALLGSIIAVNPEVRAAVVSWVKEQFGQFTHYYPAQKTTPASEERKQYELSWLPEGYMLMGTLPGEERKTLIYINGSGSIMQFHYIYNTSDGAFFDGTDCVQKSVLVNERVADLYLALDPNSASGIVWTDHNSGVLFCIATTADEDTLIQLASGVTEKN